MDNEIYYFPDEEVKKNLQKNLEILDKVIIKKEPIITFNGEPMFYERTINTIQGRDGSHKSRFAGHIASVLVGNTEIMGMKANKNYEVLYCDTERDIDDELPIDMQNIRRLSGQKAGFNYYSFYNVKREKRSEKLVQLINEMKTSFKHLVLFVDVVTDFVTSFNDLPATNNYLDIVNQITKDKDCTLFFIIHENPSKENQKARGHLGTELVNKSNTVLSIGADKKDESLFKIRMLKQRRAKKLNNIYVRYNDELKELVLVENAIERQLKSNLRELSTFLNEFMKSDRTYSQKEMNSAIMEKFQISSRTVRERLKALMTNTDKFNLKIKLELTKGIKNSNHYRIIQIPKNSLESSLENSNIE